MRAVHTGGVHWLPLGRLFGKRADMSSLQPVMSTSEEKPPFAKGVYAALATPRRKDPMEADAGELLDYLDAVVHAGVDGLVLFGSTGEFVHFNIEERMRVLGLAIRRSRVPMLVNISHSTFEGAVQLAENAVAVEAHGLLLMPPYYYRYDDDQLQSFFESFVKEVGTAIPTYLYNIPSCTNAISPELAARLLNSGTFAGIKDSGDDATLFGTLSSLKQQLPFSFLIGHEKRYLQDLRAGADGVVSGVAAAVPELPVALDRAIRNDNGEKANRLNARLEEFLVWVDRFPATVAIKQAAVHRGWPLNHFAFPLGDRTNAEIARFRHWLDEWLPAVLAECS
jgi:dihydrodipicolinate synthase/N-acetylneuraminate lyase